MPDRRPALSVLVLTHDYGRFLGECLDAVLAQTYADFEVIVLDDASTDGTVRVASGYAGDARVRVIRHEENRGFAASIIEGTEVYSRGAYLMVVSADDLVLDRCAFERQMDALNGVPGAVACVTAYTKLGPGKAREVRRLGLPEPVVGGRAFVRRLLTDREFTVLHTGALIRAEAYRAAGGYRGDLHNYLDLAFFLRLGHTGPIACIDEPLYGYRIHEGQLSGSAFRRREVLEEGLAVLREATRDARIAGIEVTEARVLRTRIADLALGDAFAGRRRLALRRCGDAFATAPAIALTSFGWWMAFVRAIVGSSGWRWLSRLDRFGPRRLRMRAPAG